MYVYLYICINQIYLTKKKEEVHEQKDNISCKEKKIFIFFKEGYILSFWPLVLDIDVRVLLHQTLSSDLFVLMLNIQDI